MCKHLEILENYIKEAGFKETFRGQPWSSNCREWVYYNGVLNTQRLKEKLKLVPPILIHDYFDPKAGSELGFVCTECYDGIMGPHPKSPHANDCKKIT